MRLRIAALALLCAAPVFASEPYLVKDINPLYQSDGSTPDRFVSLGSVAVFGATTAEEGRELWASDGTAAGTVLLADICSGECSAAPRGLLVTPKGYFFVAVNEDSEREVWLTRGTPGSTIRLATRLGASLDILPHFLESQGVLYFVAHDDLHGQELWRSDGTPAGTYLVADLYPGPGPSNIGPLRLFAGRLFFSADNGTTGPSLWSSDGTAAGTRLVKDTSPRDVYPQGQLTGMVPTSRFLYFFANSFKGFALWRSDGTPRGTQVVSDPGFAPHPESPQPRSVTTLGSRLLFLAETAGQGEEIWTSDGTRAGTRRITNFQEPLPVGRSGLLYPVLPLGDRLVFAVNDGVNGRELWVTDGTPKGTRLFLDVLPGPASGVGSLWTIQGGRILFTGMDGRRGNELWTTDGTRTGTRILRDICRGSCDSFPYGYTPFNDGLLFFATSRNGREMWQTNGTTAGTVRITNIVPADGILKKTAIPGKLLFAARDAVHGEELWISDGTAAGTRLVADLNDANQAGSGPGTFMRLGGELVFAASDGQHRGLWKSDGTAAGTTFVHSFAGPAAFLDFGDWEEAGGLLFFALRPDGEPLPRLWRTDGTDAGTFQLDLGGLYVTSELRAAGNKLFFTTRDESFNYSLGVSDGTPGGTRILTNNDWYATAIAPRELTSFQNKLFFFAGDGLWVSDGTDAGTFLVKSFNRDFTNLTVHQGFLYFYAQDEEIDERALWRSDGTAAGTVKAADLPPRFDSSQPLFVTSSGPLLFLWNLTVEGQEGLWVSDGTTTGTRWVSPVHLRQAVFVPPVVLDGVVYFFGREGGQETLWRSDGTPAGTYPVLDEEGPGFWLSSPIAASGGLLFFAESAADIPLWRSDGTAAGSSVIRELAAGSGSTLSEGSPFAIGSQVFFQACDPATGTELWAIDTRED